MTRRIRAFPFRNLTLFDECRFGIDLYVVRYIANFILHPVLLFRFFASDAKTARKE